MLEPGRGRLITIEGLDGAGKTTVARALEAELTRRGVDVRMLREPGGVDAAERIRELVKDPSAQIGARAEALLYAAARAQLVEEALEPLLATGTWVLLEHDEFFRRTAEAYAELAAAEPERIRTIDASRSEASVLDAAIAAIADLV